MKVLTILLLTLALAGSTAACDDRTCTEIGCLDSLTFELPESDQWNGSAVEICVGDLCGAVEAISGDLEQMTGPLAGEVRLDGDRIVWIGPPERLDYEAPVGLEVTSDFGGTGVRFDPTWETTRPNGPNCPPVCRSAVITVDN